MQRSGRWFLSKGLFKTSAYRDILEVRSIGICLLGVENEKKILLCVLLAS